MEEKFVQFSPEQFLEEAVGIIKKAQEAGLCLRILGALAVYLHSEHCPEYREYFFSLGRLGEGKPIFTDLDVMGYSRQSQQMRKFFDRDLGFTPDLYVNSWNATTRNIFHHKQGLYDVDVFYDKLNFSHPVEFGTAPGRGRLELDYPTITLTDIVLEKLQIHHINKKDLIDLMILFCGHELAEQDEKEKINLGYIAKTLKGDWGFWFDSKTNLEKVLSIADEFSQSGKVKTEDLDLLKKQIGKVQQRLETEPKTPAWVKRSRLGTKRSWYNDVEEVAR
ncbi:MAG: hypothetical protein WCN99_03770 [bacterium]